MSIKKTASKIKPDKSATKAATPSAALVPVKRPLEKFNNGKARKSFKVWVALDARAKEVKGPRNVSRNDSFAIGRRLCVPFSMMNNYFYRWRRFNGVTGVIGGKNIGNGAKKPAPKAPAKKIVSKASTRKVAPKSVPTKKTPAKTKEKAKPVVPRGDLNEQTNALASARKVAKKAPTALQVATKRAKKTKVTPVPVEGPQAPDSGPLSGQDNG